MSYDIYLKDPVTGSTIEFEEPLDIRGGTYAIGGTTEAWFNITWNYGKHFRRVLGEKGIRAIYGLTGEESLPLLRKAIGELEGKPDPDYWASTEGNAKAALRGLVTFAERAPHGVWEGD